ncbi:MAG: DUF308 domain-containing protein [Planctomycetes bacterium]|nr:DUF308 domain-containing protein [Planctomycetota bacterium]
MLQVLADRWWVVLLRGILAIGAGIATLAWPGLTLVLLIFLIGIATLAWPGLTGILLLSLIAGWAIARGIMEIIVAIRLRKVIDNEIMMGLSGLLSIGFGALLIMYPGEGALAMAMFIGAFLIAVGVTAVILSFRLKGLKSKLRGMA